MVIDDYRLTCYDRGMHASSFHRAAGAPFLGGVEGAVFRREKPFLRVSFRNMCIEATAAGLFRVPQRSNRALAVTAEKRVATITAIAVVPEVVRTRFNFIAGASAAVLLRRVRDQTPSQKELADVSLGPTQP